MAPTALSRAPEELFLGALVVAGMSPAVTAACRDLSPQTGRATTFGWLGFAYTIGALLSTWVAHLTIPIWPGFRAQYWIGAVMSGIVLVILAIFYRDLSPASGVRSSTTRPRP